MSLTILIQCPCGNTAVAYRDHLLKNPSMYVECRGLTRDRETCKNRWKAEEILKQAGPADEVNMEMPPQQLTLGETQ